MVVISRYLQNIEQSNRIQIPPILKEYILNLYGTEPSLNISFTEQDIHENIRKILRDYSNGTLQLGDK